MRHFTFVAAFLAGALTSTKTEGSFLRSLKSTSDRQKLDGVAICKAADDFCKAIVGPQSYCQEKKDNKFFCHGSDFQCNCESTEQPTSAPEETTTTPIPTSVDTTATSTPKVNVIRRTQEVPATSDNTTPIPRPSGECEDMPSGDVPAALWIENTSVLSSSRDAVNKFYSQVLAYMNGNCARIRTTKLIVRVYHPEYPSKDGAYYAPSTNSALFTELLSKLPSSTQVHFYPYVMDAFDQGKWAAYAGKSDVIANVFQFAADWNKILSAAGAPTVRSIVIDNEEIRGWSNHDQLISDSNINKLKASSGVGFGISLGFDETPKLNQWASFVDQFYLQAYDFYAPTAGIDQSSNSRFLTMQNQGASLAQYIDGQAIAQKQWDAYAKDPSRVTLMWSTQEISGTGCLYPLPNGSCGANHEFGSWSPRAFNDFLHNLTQKNPTAAAVGHAVFQFAFMPKSWMPMSARN